MALARERSSQQGFDPSSLDFFGGCSDGHITSLFDQQEPQSIVDFKAAADQWGGAYPSSSSSVLSFEQGGRPPDTKYSSQLDQEEECAAWINTVEHEYRSDHHRGSRLGRDTNCFEMTDGYGCADGQQEDRFGLLYPSSSSGAADCMIGTGPN